MSSLFKVDDLKKTPMIVLSGHGSSLSRFIFTPCSTKLMLQRERKYNLVQVFKYAQHPVDQNLLIICLYI